MTDPGMLSGYLIFIMQTTSGLLMERIVARKLAQDLDLERRNVLPPKQGGYRKRRKKKKKNPLGKTQPDSHTMSTMSLAVVVDLEDAYNRVQFKLQFGVSLILTRWLTAALRERTVSMRLGNWISTPQQLTLILPKPTPPPPSRSPVLYNVCTKELANLNSNGLSRVLTLADDRLIYKTATDSHTAVNAIQEQLKRCHISAKSSKSI